MYKACTDNVTISPWQSCVKENTAMTCSSTAGYPMSDSNPVSPSYSWTHTRLDNGTTVTATGESYTVPGIGFHHLQCNAIYSHEYCPEYWTACHVNITVETFSQYILLLLLLLLLPLLLVSISRHHSEGLPKSLHILLL